MAAIGLNLTATPGVWLSALRRPLFSRPHVAAAPDFERRSLPELPVSMLGIEYIEERVRAATSGFEMGDYDPPAMRG